MTHFWLGNQNVVWCSELHRNFGLVSAGRKGLKQVERVRGKHKLYLYLACLTLEKYCMTEEFGKGMGRPRPCWRCCCPGDCSYKSGCTQQPFLLMVLGGMVESSCPIGSPGAVRVLRGVGREARLELGSCAHISRVWAPAGSLSCSHPADTPSARVLKPPLDRSTGQTPKTNL